MRRLAVLLLTSFVCLSGSNLYAFSGGTGSSGDPYLISTAAELNSVGSNSTYWSKYFKLTANIDMSGYTGTSYNIIGSSSTYFTGGFNGNGFVISNLTYTTAAAVSDIGMFGWTDHAYIQNVQLQNVNISSTNAATQFTGGLIGYQAYGTTTNCSTSGTVVGVAAVGGLIGDQFGGVLSNCSSSCNVSGSSSRVGGLVGLASCTITNSYSTGNVSSIGSSNVMYVGGLIGNLYFGSLDQCYSTGSVSGQTVTDLAGLAACQDNSTITNCYTTASVSTSGSSWYVGGLVGFQTNSTLTNSYSASTISAPSSTYVGGSIGYSSTGNPTTITACFWDTETSGLTDGVGNQDPDPSSVMGEVTSTLQMASTYTAVSWDFTTVWLIPVEGATYPVLSWQPSTYGGGLGTSTYPWKIYNKSQLEYLGNHPGDYNKYFILTANIDLTGTTYTQALIAPDTNAASGGFQGTGFNGNFNGNGFAVSNITITMTAGDFAGLFGYVYGSGQVSNLGIENAAISGLTYVGSLAGANLGILTNCHAAGTIDGSSDYAGGLTGYNGGTITGCYASPTVNGYHSAGGLTGYSNASGTISNSYATGAVNGNSYIGGLVGQNWGSVSTSYATGTADGTDYIGGLTGNNYGTISNSYASGAAAGHVFWIYPSTYHHSYYVGGLIGYNSGTVTSCFAQGSATRQGIGGSLYHAGGLVGYNISGSITSCYASGLVTGTTNVGGFVGNHYSGSITNCYSSGSVSGTTFVGGLAGHTTSGSVTNSFWDTDTSGQPTSAGGTGKTTAQMKMESTFTGAGWDLAWVDGDSADWVLWIEGASYPVLSWQSATFGGGTGTPTDPWKITSAQNLLFLAYNSAYYSGNYLLITDIDMSAYTGTQYKVIGNNTTNFTGTFDGGGHVISNLTYSTTSTANYTGMFGFTYNATIRNLGLTNALIHSHGNSVGGLVGYHYRGYINNCFTTGSVEGVNSVGGLVGAELGSINNSYSTASATSTGTLGGVGGLTGTITGYSRYGVRKCYSTGAVTGTARVGGLNGYSNAGIIENCFWNTTTSGQGTSVGGTGLTTAQMKIKSNFTAAAWDFLDETANGTDDFWRMCVNGVSYPKLTWQLATHGDFACPDGDTMVDFPYLAQHWLLTGCNYTNDYCGWADIDVSGTVDTADLLIFADHWLQ